MSATQNAALVQHGLCSVRPVHCGPMQAALYRMLQQLL